VKIGKFLIKLILVVLISLTLLACSREAIVKTTVDINPLDQSKITEMIIERPDKTILVRDQKVIDTVIEKLSKIKVKKLSPEQKKSFLDNEQRKAAGYTYNLILRNEAHEAKSYAMLLYNQDNKALLFVDVKTMMNNSRPVSYANTDDMESLDDIGDIYNIATAETYKDFLNKANAKGINEIMLKTLGNLGYGEEEILNLSSDKLRRIFAPGTHLDGGGFDPNEEQRTELEKLGIDTDMSVILGNLGYEYEEMLQLSPEEIDFIFPNTELIPNLVARGYNEQDVQRWVVNSSGKTYKEIIKEALQKPEVKTETINQENFDYGDELNFYLNDEKTNNNPTAISVVKEYLVAKRENDYDTWLSTLTPETQRGFSREMSGDFWVISFKILDIHYETDTGYKHSILKCEKANEIGLTADNIAVVYALYDVKYDNTKVPSQSGEIQWRFDLIREDNKSPWYIQGWGYGYGGI